MLAAPRQETGTCSLPGAPSGQRAPLRAGSGVARVARSLTPRTSRNLEVSIRRIQQRGRGPVSGDLADSTARTPRGSPGGETIGTWRRRGEGQTDGRTRGRSQTGPGLPPWPSCSPDGSRLPPVQGHLTLAQTPDPRNSAQGEETLRAVGAANPGAHAPSEAGWTQKSEVGRRREKAGKETEGQTRTAREKEAAGRRGVRGSLPPAAQWGQLAPDAEGQDPRPGPQPGPDSASRLQSRSVRQLTRPPARQLTRPPARRPPGGPPGVGPLSPAGLPALRPGAARGHHTRRRSRSSGLVPRSLGTCPGLAASRGPRLLGSDSPAPCGVFSFYE